MTSQRVSLSILASYDKDNNSISELCRTCLCKTDDEYISIESILPWSPRDSCSAQQLIEQLLNRELCNVQPQPQRVCSTCVKKIRAISLFRKQCIESDRILSEFHKHLGNKPAPSPPLTPPSNIDLINEQSDFEFDMDDIIFSEQIVEKFLPVFDADIFKLESSVLDEIRRDLNPPPEIEEIKSTTKPTALPILTTTIMAQTPPPTRTPTPTLAPMPMPIQMPMQMPMSMPITMTMPTTTAMLIAMPMMITTPITMLTPKQMLTPARTLTLVPTPLPQRNPSSLSPSPLPPPPKQSEETIISPVTKPIARKKTKKIINTYDNEVDMYDNKILKDDIKASLKKRTRKYKKEKPDENFTGLCEQCGLTFSNASDYKKHIRRHEDKANQTFKFHCKFCSKGFNHKQTYNIHHNSHTREIKFICDICGKELATKNSLRIHFRYHLGIKNHVCPKCGHRFVTPRELRDHVEKKHATVRAIACTYSDCSETFDSEYRLNLHLRVHETNYAFRCDICGVATVSKFRLGVHKKIHTGEMIRHCPICQKKLAHDNALRRHIKNVHGDRNKAPNGIVSKSQRTITLDGIILTTSP